jgi:hypothetical protein
MFKDIEDWRTQTKNQQGADNVDRLPGTRNRLPGFFPYFSIKMFGLQRFISGSSFS